MGTTRYYLWERCTVRFDELFCENPFAKGGSAHGELSKSREDPPEFPEHEVDHELQKNQTKPAMADLRGDEHEKEDPPADPPQEAEEKDSEKSNPSGDESDKDALPKFTLQVTHPAEFRKTDFKVDFENRSDFDIDLKK